MDLRFWKGILAAGFAAASALLGLAAVFAWFLRQQKRKRLLAHLLHLASDIVSVAETIDQDLVGATGGQSLGHFRARSGEYRERAEAFLAHHDRLDGLAIAQVTRALELLHDEHRRIVDLRSEVDAALAASRQSHFGGGRMRKFGWASETNSSRPASSGFRTQPSTLA